MKNPAIHSMKLVAAALCLLGACSTFAGAQPANQAAKPRKAALVPVPPAEPHSFSLPRTEPEHCESARLRAEQAERKRLREFVDWTNLDPSLQDLLWDDFVGPDQLNDGFGRARVRPSLQEQSGYQDRGDNPDSPLVDLSWVFTPSASGLDRQLFDLNLNVEGDVALTGTAFQTSGINLIRVTEIQGTADATQGYVANWNREFYELDPDGSDVAIEGRACTSDLRGFSFAGGKRGPNQYHIAQFNGASGDTVRSRAFNATPIASNAAVSQMVVDAEGILYVIGTYLEAGDSFVFIARHEPGTLNQTWITTVNHLDGQPLRLSVDRFGDLYALTTSASGRARLSKLSSIDGVVEWTWLGPTATRGRDMELDFAGNPHVVAFGQSANNWQTFKIDRLTGAAVWSPTLTNGAAIISNGEPKDLALDSAGNIFVVGTQGSSTAKLVKYTPAGVAAAGFISPEYNTTGSVARVAVDWAGNPYVAATFGSTTGTLDVRKFDPDDGGQNWACYTISPEFTSSEVNTSLSIQDLIVDAGGSVYVGGYRNISGGGKEFYCVRWEQPFVEIPLVATSNPVIRVEDHSVWLPHIDEAVAGDAFNNRFNLFDLEIPAGIESTTDSLLRAEINYVAGTVKGEIDLDLINNPTIGVDFVTTATGGTFDAAASGRLSMVLPATVIGGTAFDIALEFIPDPAGMEMTANAQPEFTASLKSHVTGDIDLTVRGWNRNGGIFGAEFEPIFPDWHVIPQSFNLASLNDQTIMNIFGAIPPEPGTWIDFEYGFVDGRFTMPDLKSKAAYSPVEVPARNTGNPNDDDFLRLSSSISSTFCDLGVGITDIITTAATRVPLSFSAGLPVGDGATDASLSVGVVQASLNGDMKMEQDLTMDIKPYVRLEFPGTSIPTQTVDLVRRQAINGGFKFVPESTVRITPPASGSIQVKSTFGVRSTMQNTSGIRFGASADFNSFELDAGLSLLDVNVFSIYECWGCFSQPIFSQRVNLYDNTIIPNAFQEFSWPEVALSDVTVPIDPDNDPVIIGASRAEAPMIIYDQQNPTRDGLTAAASGDQPMVIYGRQFFTGTGQANRAFIQHYGRTEQLTTTRLNDQSLLVQLPRRFMLLPGTARIWVTNGNGTSKTTDFPIVYPFPNFKGVLGLDGPIDPVLWAGDPRRVAEPLRAIDGGTPAGNDSFLARRDYYTLMRTTLWSSGLFPAGHASANLTAQQYFPSFPGWELSGAPKAPPAFPTLVFDGVALGRKPGLAADGYFKVRLPDSLYALPHVATMTLVNPGPGGGPSRDVSLTIPAPRPVLSRLLPASVQPGSVAPGETLRLVVTGPDAVPYFAGYEAVKSGNFTPESVILVDGVPVATQFINSGRLVAAVPDFMLVTPGARLITVETPSGGTSYIESQRLGTGATLVPQLTNSGGISVPLTLDVVWGQPEIRAITPGAFRVGQPPQARLAVNGVPPTDSHNISINGKGFAPGCRVFCNGRLLDSVRESDRNIRATLTAFDVPIAGNARFIVVNPAPAARTSVPFLAPVNP